MKAYCKPKYEVADIMNLYGQDFKNSNKLHSFNHKVMGAIQTCRTSVLGGHVDKCTNCNHKRSAYNSCRNRHCPKCQGMNQLKWVDNRSMDLLPVNYFHLVFTIPHELNRLCLINRKVLYTILFKAAAETVTMLAQDKKHLGATPGITSVLHTWGQNLMEHPHVHMIVTGGGINQQTGQWMKSRKKFFIPVKVLSRVFRGKFLSKLKDAYKDDQLLLVGRIAELKNTHRFEALLNTLYKKQWVVYAK
ncbi:MAG: transposase zinc-binding domain-containing protein, partial [Flavobacteriales bacterium]|nr:transposase zinc-binding domain-containing protein [Flavobacteriales bacterium]